jgi:SAM-dependent methyltransferase
MDTPLSPDNPFGPNRTGFAWEKVPLDGRAHLDFGCGNGRLLAALRARGKRRLVGLDVSREAIEAARETLLDVEFVHTTRTVPLPFDDATFDSITMLDVLEHLPEPRQRAVLAEFHRVLTDGGVLIVTVPGQHVFSALDLGNLKFRFPRLHRWFFCLNHSRDEYERRYVANADGLVGDISAEKAWHEHFTPRRLEALLNPAGFDVITFDGSALFMRVISPFNQLLGRLPLLKPLFAKVNQLDARWFRSANLFCVARRKAGYPGSASDAGAQSGSAPGRDNSSEANTDQGGHHHA